MFEFDWPIRFDHMNSFENVDILILGSFVQETQIVMGDFKDMVV